MTSLISNFTLKFPRLFWCSPSFRYNYIPFFGLLSVFYHLKHLTLPCCSIIALKDFLCKIILLKSSAISNFLSLNYCGLNSCIILVFYVYKIDILNFLAEICLFAKWYEIKEVQYYLRTYFRKRSLLSLNALKILDNWYNLYLETRVNAVKIFER